MSERVQEKLFYYEIDGFIKRICPYFRHAGIYTRQEAIFISENKLTKLQGLYIDQINRLHHILKEKRRQYLHAIRKEREVLCT